LSHMLYGFSAIVLVLLLALGWFAFSGARVSEPHLNGRHERDWTHISYLPYIKQTLAEADIEFLKRRGSPTLAKRIRADRQRIALAYLAALRKDFEKLLRMGGVLAVMSPKVEALSELRGLRVRAEFSYLYYSIYLRLVLGIAPFEAVGNLSDMVSALTVQMESAVSELTERAALPTELLP
jgi:hypothetical protein